MWEVFIDGASKGNPGEASVGILIRQDGKVAKTVSKAIGLATNNVAEYTALLYALEELLAMNAKKIKVHTDSALLYNQLLGKYQVKNDLLKTLFDQAQELGRKFEDIQIVNIPREKNQEADQLANQAFKKEQAKGVASAFHAGEESPSSEG